MHKQIPAGPEHLTCPLHQKSMKRVCEKCPLWVQIRGKDHNTGQEVDEWTCSLAWLPMLLIEVAQNARSGAAATENLRNQADEQFRQSVQVAARLARMGPPPAQQIGNGQAPFIIEGDAGSSTRHQGLIPQGEHHET